MVKNTSKLNKKGYILSISIILLITLSGCSSQIENKCDQVNYEILEICYNQENNYGLYIRNTGDTDIEEFNLGYVETSRTGFDHNVIGTLGRLQIGEEREYWINSGTVISSFQIEPKVEGNIFSREYKTCADKGKYWSHIGACPREPRIEGIDFSGYEYTSANAEEIEQLNQLIQDLTNQLEAKEIELTQTKAELETTTELYEEAQPYHERVLRGELLNEYFVLLGDYEIYTQDIVLDYLGFSVPIAPATDEELWQRGKLIYDWLAENYAYCGDKGLRVGNTFNEFQFYSPDELLVSDNARCGDCDDFSTLFAGMMYASGVPKDNVWMVCGTVDDSRGHCWNYLSLDEATYRIDGVCSQSDALFAFLDFSWGLQGAYYTDTHKNVDCWDTYNPEVIMNPYLYKPIN